MQALDMQNMDLNTGYPINEYIELQTLYESQYGVSITTSAFDSHQELFWTGTDDGRVSSYYGASLAKYTSFKVPTDSSPDVKMIFPHRENNIFVLTSECFSCYSRYGVNVFKHKEVSFQNLQCMFFNQQERFFLGGFSDQIYDFDIERLRVLRQLSVIEDQKDCILIKASSTTMSGNSSRNGIVCTGSTNGQIIVRDACSLKSIHKFHPHNGSLSDFDVHGNYLASCGFSNTRGGNLCVDRFMMVYDLRMMRALNPVQLHIESAFLHYLPMCSSVVAVASQAGCFQLLDTNLMTPSGFYQAQMPPGGLATTFSMSENSQAVAFGHSSGSVNLLTKGENIVFNDFSEETLFVDPPQVSSAYIDINNEIAPLSSIPVPLIEKKRYVSDWAISSQKTEYRPTPTLNPEIMSNSRVIHGIISVPNRFDIKRNQIYDKDYEEHLKELKETRGPETSIHLNMMIQKPLETVEKGIAKEEEEEEAIQSNEVKELNENKTEAENEEKKSAEASTNEKSS